MQKIVTRMILVGTVVAAMLVSGCGSSSKTAAPATVSGIAATGLPISGQVYLKDSAATPKELTAPTAKDGSYVFNVSGLTAPFIVKVQWTDANGSQSLVSFANAPGTANINPLTNMIVANAAGVSDTSALYNASLESKLHIAGSLQTSTTQVTAQLKPLLDKYGVTVDPISGPFVANHTGLDALLDGVNIAVSGGSVTVANRTSGATIFSAPVANMMGGTFTAANMPTVAPGQGQPAVDGAALYASNCADCHGALATSSKKGASVARIQSAINSKIGGMGSLSNLTTEQVQAIAMVLAPASPGTPAPAPAPTPTPTPGTTPPTLDGAALYASNCADCHGALATSGKKGITLARLDNGINGDMGGMGSLSLSVAEEQAIVNALAGTSTTPTPAPTPTPADGAALYASKCAGCHGSLAVSTKKGMTLARLNSAVSANIGGMGYLSSLTAAENQAIVDALAPTSPAPAPVPTPVPTPTPTTTDGAAIYADRCAGCHGSLATSSKRGITLQRLDISINGDMGGMGYLSSMTTTEKQAVVNALATPAPTPTPTPVPADGAALYAANCAGCHGVLASSTKLGTTLSRLQSAISNNVAGMGMLSSLSATQVQAIVDVLTVVNPTPTPTPTDGAALYASNCAGCHGALASSGKAGATLTRIQTAINNNAGNMGYLSSLTSAQVQGIADALAAVTPPPPPTPTPADGPTLYASNCAGCHGALASSTKAGATLTRIQGAITNNVGNMGYLSSLTAAQVQGITDALAAVTPPPPPATIDGAALYASNCAGCHSALASSTKGGATATRIQTAITNNVGNMGYLSTLTSAQVQGIATALATVTPPSNPTPACGSCHALPPSTGRHSKHKSRSCATCHGTGYSTTTVNAATHNNGVKNIVTTIGWNPTSRSCTNSCHGKETW